MAYDFYIGGRSIDEPRISASGAEELRQASNAFDAFMNRAVRNNNPRNVTYKEYAPLIPRLKKELRRYGGRRVVHVGDMTETSIPDFLSEAGRFPDEEYVPTRLTQILEIFELAARERSPIRLG